MFTTPWPSLATRHTRADPEASSVVSIRVIAFFLAVSALSFSGSNRESLAHGVVRSDLHCMTACMHRGMTSKGRHDPVGLSHDASRRIETSHRVVPPGVASNIG